jgi:hypothetical protein
MARRPPPGTPALSIRQPWAWAIVAGHKDVENRTWTTRYRGPLLIHASTKVDRAGIDIIRSRRVVLPDELTVGALIGYANLADVVTSSRSRWALDGHYHFLLTDPVMFKTPVACAGRLGLFQPKESRHG